VIRNRQTQLAKTRLFTHLALRKKYRSMKHLLITQQAVVVALIKGPAQSWPLICDNRWPGMHIPVFLNTTHADSHVAYCEARRQNFSTHRRTALHCCQSLATSLLQLKTARMWLLPIHGALGSIWLLQPIGSSVSVWKKVLGVFFPSRDKAVVGMLSLRASNKRCGFQWVLCCDKKMWRQRLSHISGQGSSSKRVDRSPSMSALRPVCAAQSMNSFVDRWEGASQTQTTDPFREWQNTLVGMPNFSTPKEIGFCSNMTRHIFNRDSKSQ